MLAMGMLLKQMGKHADLVTADRIPPVYRGLPGADSIRSAMRVHGPYDAVILLECDGLERARLRGLEEFLLINIDHHVSGSKFGQINWIDCDAASVGEMVYRLVKAAGATLTPEMAVCLYTTVLTDTGGFCYGATRPATFALAHELTLAGADPIRVAQDIYFSTTAAKMLLLGAALSNLKREGSLAWLWVTHQDMVRSCAAEEDSEGIVNYAVCISGVEAAAFLRELPERRHPIEPAQQGPDQRGGRLPRGWAAAATRVPQDARWKGRWCGHSMRYWPCFGWRSRRVRTARPDAVEIDRESVSLVICSGARVRSAFGNAEQPPARRAIPPIAFDREPGIARPQK